jgi:hypothetical protein
MGGMVILLDEDKSQPKEGLWYPLGCDVADTPVELKTNCD